jgi:hypothetical protein
MAAFNIRVLGRDLNEVVYIDIFEGPISEKNVHFFVNQHAFDGEYSLHFTCTNNYVSSLRKE